MVSNPTPYTFSALLDNIELLQVCPMYLSAIRLYPLDSLYQIEIESNLTNQKLLLKMENFSTYLQITNHQNLEYKYDMEQF
jgi:hypothetical protein